MDVYLKRLAFTLKQTPLVLLLLAVLAFGPQITRLGFYWDDWAKILSGYLFGLDSYPAYYAEDRPVSAWTHMLFTPLAGYAPLGWHVLALLLRWLSAWAMLWMLNLLWPRARWQNFAAAALFLVYPVFTQQAAAVTFHQQWLQYALFLFSLGAMILGLRAASRPRRRAWTAAALAAVALQFSVTEYFIPVELVRIAVVYLLFRQARSGAARQGGGMAWAAVKAYAPYGVLLAGYAVYRLFIYLPPAGSDPYRAETLFNFAADPLGTLQALGLTVIVDEMRILVTSWADLLQFEIAGAAPFTLLSYALGLAGGGLLAAALLAWREDGERAVEGAPGRGWPRQAFWLGLLGVLVGPIPAWITGRQVVFDFHSDRYALPAMFGAALLLAAVIDWLGKARLQKAVMVSLLAALAVGLHLRAGNEYRWLWTDQLRFYWQLHWRAPGLEPSTVILTENEPFPNQGLFSTSAALNLLYPQTAAARSGAAPLGVWMYTLLPRFHEGLPDDRDVDFNTTFRTLHFEGNLERAVLVHRDPRFSNCLWMLRPEDTLHPYLPVLVRDFLPVSNLSQVQPEAGHQPPVELFGEEPEHGWCYFYEKADLARQLEDWETAARLYDEARAAGYAPGGSESKSPYEWLPMMEALQAVGRTDEAASLFSAALQADPGYRAMLCQFWSAEPDPAWACPSSS